MLIDAVVLAGGRYSRLGTVAKASLRVGGRSLLELAVSSAMSVSRHCVVVGPIEPSELGTIVVGDAAAGNTVLVTREDPPYAGPAAALGAGVLQLAASAVRQCDAILVLACDMPFVGGQLPALVSALEAAPADVDGAISVDSTGQRQPLASLYRTRPLTDALARISPESLVGRSMRDLIDPLNLLAVTELPGSTDDVDTWEDAARLGAAIATEETKEGAP
jgi:molybdopterin-guanine dinucleotide biosynthesis protein A